MRSRFGAIGVTSVNTNLKIALLFSCAFPLTVCLTSASSNAQVPTLPGPASSLPASRSAGKEKPWRVEEHIGWSWLQFGLEHRIRFEHLGNDFRTANPGDSTGFFLRTLLFAEARISPIFVGFELKDARAWTSSSTPLNTTLVDPLDLLQGYVGLRGSSLILPGDDTSLAAGRMTINLGSRRLVARNDFRNTINAFTGVHAQWISPSQDIFRTFIVVPVVRLPSEAEELRRNQLKRDQENRRALFWGAFFQGRPLAAKVIFETYLLGLHEGDSDLAPSSDRRLYTPGFRALRPSTPGEFDFQFEVISQFGYSRVSTAAKDTNDLDHLAYSVHASGGFRFRASWFPHILLIFDYASGDRSPVDGMNNRFDPLFGARRFDFGPTGIYGAFARSNLISPSIRVGVDPHRTVDAFAAYRPAWLASPRDAWTTSGLRDPDGRSGRFLGHQVEARVRWHIFPKNLSLDIGSALLLRGDFARKIPKGEDAPSAYLYSQLTGTI
ncbi:MAG: alginate export family protein [Myxococcales bacterium]|nr:alginate export family protein [Polyangiaceae bacterium]MDW8248367.1 alginate export family protein [Myxococcales bacterium]